MGNSDFDHFFITRIKEIIKSSNKEILEDESKMKEFINLTLLKYENILLDDLKCNTPQMLKERRFYAANFNKRLYRRWKEPIDLLETLLQISLDVGAEFNDSHRKVAIKNNDFLFDILTRQHARACQIGYEILNLLKSGLADGAFGRWRSLYETVVISSLIKKYEKDLPERFLKYEIIESYKQSLVYDQCCMRLGYEPLEEEIKQSLKKQKDALLNIYGKNFYKEYGWISETILKKPNFANIEELMDFDHIRPYYKMSCFNVHSGPKSIRFKLGLTNGSNDELILSGPSNYGLAILGNQPRYRFIK